MLQLLSLFRRKHSIKGSSYYGFRKSIVAVGRERSGFVPPDGLRRSASKCFARSLQTLSSLRQRADGS